MKKIIYSKTGSKGLLIKSFGIPKSLFKRAYFWKGILRKNKLASIPFIIVLILFASLYVLNALHPEKGHAAWWDDNWGYRMVANISNSGSNLTDYQIPITVDTASLISAGKMRPDCYDIRLTDVNGNLLPYWIQTNINACNNASTIIWVKASSIPTSGQTVYIYYGNPTATNAQNGNQVFTFFDDFSNNNQRWTATAGTLTISGGVASFSGAGCQFFYNPTTLVSAPAVVEYGARPTSGTQSNPGVDWPMTGVSSFGTDECTGTSGDWYLFSPFANNLANARIYEKTGTSYALRNDQSASTSNNTWYRVSASNNGSGALSLSVDGTQKASYSDGDPRSNGPGNIGFREGPQQIDWVGVRKYAATEPTVSLGTEEKSPAPQSYWAFDEGTGTVANDGGINHYNGTVSAATWLAENMCVAGKCLSFDGSSSYVNIGDKYDFTNNAPFSFSLWVNPTDISTSTWRRIISKEVTDGNGRQGIILYQNKDTSQIVLEMWRDGTSKSATTTNVPLNSWTYITATYDGTNMRIYQNGILKGTTASSLSLSDISANFVIGRYSSGGGYYKGKLDEPKVYNYALSDTQIKANYNARGSEVGSAAVLGAYDDENLSNGLVGYWKMDEASWTNDCSTTSVTDSSGNGNNGTSCPNGSGVSTLSTGKFGNAPTFDGNNDYVEVANASSLQITNQLTVCAWVYSAQTSMSGGIYDKTVGGSTNTSHLLFAEGTAYKWRVDRGGLTTISSTSNLTSLQNKWSHLCGTYSSSAGGVLTLFVNGKQESTTSIGAGAIDTGDGVSRIGDLGGDIYPYNGRIDEVRVYNRTLSGEEVAQLYNWAPGPVAYYNFEEGQGNTMNDTSGYENDATISGAGYRWVQGKYGKALYSGTSGYATAPNTDSINLGSVMTASFWMKSPLQVDYQFLLQKGITANGTKWSIQTSGSGGGIAAKQIYIRIDTSGGANQTGCSISNVTDNNWHHVAFVINSGNVSCYKDGSFVTSFSYTQGNGFADPTQPLTFWSGPGGGTHIDATLDEVKIYNYARSQQQITSDMNANHPGIGSPVASAVGQWNLDEGQGTTISNSGNGGIINGTLTNSPTWNSAGKYDNALQFNDTTGTIQYAIIPGSGALQDVTDNSFTFSAWINPKNSNHSQSMYAVTRPGFHTGLQYNPSISKPVFNIWNSSNTYFAATSTNTYPINNWMHLVGVVDTTSLTIKLYVNGRLEATTSYTGSLRDYSTTSYLLGSGTTAGVCSDSSRNCFNGLIDNVKIYNYPLSQNEVLLDYNQGKSIAFGALSDTSGLTGGSVASNSAAAEYCVPGDTTSCAAPLGRWDFEEGQGSTANDTSGNGYNGTLSSPVRWGQGQYGKGVYFPASGNVGVSGMTGLLGSTMTVEAWVNYDGINVSGFNRVVARGWVGNGWLLGVWNTSGTENAMFGIAQSSTQYNASVSLSSVGLRPGKLHLVGIYDGVATYLYINGRLVATNTNAPDGASLDTSSTIYFGNTLTNNMYMDNVRLFDYARTTAQVAWDYNQGGPVGYWKLDECQGTTANDASGNGYTGTITIGASGSQTTAGTCTTPTNGTGAWYNGRNGKYNSSMSFDGTDDNISMGDTNSLEGLSSVSFAAWINPSSLSGSRDIIQKENTYNFRMSGTTVQCWIHNGSSYVNIANATLPSSTGTWAHVACTWISGSPGKLYINGKDVTSSSTSASAMTTSANALTIGSRVSTEYFSGQIDDVKIFNYTLTSSQVKQVYNQGAAVRFGPITGTP